MVIAALGPAASGEPRKSKAGPAPDFTVQSVKIRSLRERPYHLFTGRVRDGFIVEIVVKNVGDAPRAGAGKLLVQGNAQLRPERLVFEVPRLKPGKSREIDVDVYNSDLDGIDSYRTKACASTRRDTKHRNDCRRGPNFAVIPRTWEGTTHSVTASPYPTVTTDAQVTFRFDSITKETIPGFSGRLFTYRAIGSMTSTASGADDQGCTYSGSADFPVNPPETFLKLAADLEKYRAQGDLIIAPRHTIPATVSCPEGGTGSVEVEVGTWLAAPVTRRDSEDEFLRGRQAPGFGTWTWNLRAE